MYICQGRGDTDARCRRRCATAIRSKLGAQIIGHRDFFSVCTFSDCVRVVVAIGAVTDWALSVAENTSNSLAFDGIAFQSCRTWSGVKCIHHGVFVVESIDPNELTAFSMVDDFFCSTLFYAVEGAPMIYIIDEAYSIVF